MFNSEIFTTEVYPDFNEPFQCKLRVFDKTLKNFIKVSDSIDIKRIPVREGILVLALIDVTLMKEESALSKKIALKQKLSEEWKKDGKKDILQNAVIVGQMVDSKTKKISLLKEYKKELELKIMSRK